MSSRTKDYIKENALTTLDREILKKLLKLQNSSNCLRAKVGAIVTNKKGKIIAQATNSFHSLYDCRKIGCIRDIRKIPSGTRREICYGLCAEQYAFAQMAKEGHSCEDGSIYVTSHPCRICESIIAESGIKKVVFLKGYPDIIPEYDILPDSGIEVIHAQEFSDEKPHTV
ncbi:MAG: deaminase [Candidatus Gracilibacteria bacterium]|jgi:dCMP deaminase